MLHVTQAKYTSGFKMWVSFDDGTDGEVDLTDKLTGPVFAPLKNPEYFACFTLDPDLEIVVWPNGADLAPEFLKNHLIART